MSNGKEKKLKVIKTGDLLKLSASSIKTYQQCPRKYYFTYLEKPDIPEKDWSHLTLGNFVHDVLEYFHNVLMKHPDRDIRKLMSHCCTKKEKEDQFIDKLDPEIRKAVKEMLLAYLNELEDKGVPEVQSNERNFNVYLDKDLLIRGKIDRIDFGTDDHPELFHVVDYKTGKSKYLDEFQLLVYGIPLLEDDPDIETYQGSYLALKENMKWISHTFTRTDVEKTKEKIRGIARQIREDSTWEPRPQFLCQWCDYETVCEAAPSNKKRGGRTKPFVGGEIDWE